MTQSFAFTPAQADAIRAPLGARFPPAAIKDFLEVVAVEVADWLLRWPPLDAVQLREGKRRLDNLRRHLDGLHFTLNTLDGAWKIPLWLRLQDRASPEAQAALLARPEQEGMQAGWHRTGRMMELLIEDLRRSVAEQLVDIDDHNGRNNARKVDLVERLAWSFAGVFGKDPTTTLDGAFMGIVAAVGDAVDLRVGKDAVATGIAAYRHHKQPFLG